MISPRILARLCSDLYDDSKRSQWATYWSKDDVHVGHIVVDGTDVLVLRGSDVAIDWLRDVEVWPSWHSKLGFLHAGFGRHMDDVFEEISATLGSSAVVITGHSLGGARARILAALRAVNGLPVAQVTTFGSPRPGFGKVSDIIRNSGMIHTSYRHAEDPVVLVPTILPWWTHPEGWIVIGAADDEELGLEDFEDHLCARYVEATEGLTD